MYLPQSRKDLRDRALELLLGEWDVRRGVVGQRLDASTVKLYWRGELIKFDPVVAPGRAGRRSRLKFFIQRSGQSLLLAPGAAITLVWLDWRLVTVDVQVSSADRRGPGPWSPL